MSPFEILSISLSVLAFIVSIVFLISSIKQTKATGEALRIQQEIERANAIQYFTGRFSDLVREGGLFKKFEDENWSYQFWSLLSTEFYFFHHEILPVFMYTLWCIDLGNLYIRKDGLIRANHEKYLHTYSFNYPEMTSFYFQLYEIAKNQGDESLRNQQIAEFVSVWISKNKRKQQK